jgi:hypothetical protein
MGAPAIIAALAAKDDEEIRGALVAGYVLTIPDDTDPLTWDPREVTGVGGATVQTVRWQGKLWDRDEDDVSSADEITVITLADGTNYLTNDVSMPVAVISKTIDTPPDEIDRQYGDAHLIPDAANDDWAGHEGDVALWTARGYYFRPPAVGHLLYIRDELGYVHYSEANEWEAGIGAYTIDSGGVRPSNLFIRAWSVENSTTTAPPATGPAAEQYIIGASATGAWAGHDKKIAWRPAVDAAFLLTTPFVGEEAYDRALGYRVKWTGTEWAAAGAIWVNRATSFTAGSGSTTAPSGNTFYAAYSATTAPTTAQRRRIDDVGLSYTARRTSAPLIFKYNADTLVYPTATGSGSTDIGDLVIALFRDSETNAIAWHKINFPKEVIQAIIALGGTIGSYNLHISAEFEIEANNASAHTYRIAVMSWNRVSAVGWDIFELTRRRFHVQEAA